MRKKVEPAGDGHSAQQGQPALIDEEIRVRAYQIYLERGGAPGAALDDWLQAERECQQRTGSVAGTAQESSAPPA